MPVLRLCVSRVLYLQPTIVGVLAIRRFSDNTFHVHLADLLEQFCAVLLDVVNVQDVRVPGWNQFPQDLLSFAQRNGAKVFAVLPQNIEGFR